MVYRSRGREDRDFPRQLRGETYSSSSYSLACAHASSDGQEPLPDPTTQELQREAQEEAKIFAAQGKPSRSSRLSTRLDSFVLNMPRNDCQPAADAGRARSFSRRQVGRSRAGEHVSKGRRVATPDRLAHEKVRRSTRWVLLDCCLGCFVIELIRILMTFN